MNCSRCGCPAAAHDVAHADDARARGNDAFAVGDLPAALAAYSKAIALAPGDASELLKPSRRALAEGAPGLAAGALVDAERAVRVDPNWSKARARKAKP